MNWKEFLKPDKRKIIITIVLFIIAGLLWFGMVFLAFGGFRLIEINPVFYFLIKIGLTFYGLLWPSFIFLRIIDWLIFILIPINFIYWYLLSCLIVWIINKKILRKVTAIFLIIFSFYFLTTSISDIKEISRPSETYYFTTLREPFKLIRNKSYPLQPKDIFIIEQMRVSDIVDVYEPDHPAYGHYRLILKDPEGYEWGGFTTQKELWGGILRGFLITDKSSIPVGSEIQNFTFSIGYYERIPEPKSFIYNGKIYELDCERRFGGGGYGCVIPI